MPPMHCQLDFHKGAEPSEDLMALAARKGPAADSCPQTAQESAEPFGQPSGTGAFAAQALVVDAFAGDAFAGEASAGEASAGGAFD